MPKFIDIQTVNGTHVAADDISFIEVESGSRKTQYGDPARRPVPAVNCFKVLYLKLTKQPIPWKFKSGKYIKPCVSIVNHDGIRIRGVTCKNLASAHRLREYILKQLRGEEESKSDE